jgi:hypothetical protein
MVSDQMMQALVEAERAGVDLELLESNLRLSVAERWRQHDAALNLALRLQAAKRDSDERSERTVTAD